MLLGASSRQMDGNRIFDSTEIYDSIGRLVIWRGPLGALFTWTNALPW